MGVFSPPRRPVAAVVAVAVAMAVAATTPLQVVAWPRYRERLPNGFGFSYAPGDGGSMWGGVRVRVRGRRLGFWRQSALHSRRGDGKY